MDIVLKPANKKEDGQRFNSSIGLSRFKSTRKSVSKISLYETNVQNYGTNYKVSQQKIDPRGISANSIYASFSGIIQSLELFCEDQLDLQLNYEIKIGKQWYDETPQVNDTLGKSTFCSSKNRKITFSLGFDTLVSCMYVQSWPQLILTIKGFDFDGDIITKGYAQIFLPTQPGMQVKQAAVYQIVRNQKWYHKWFPFLEPSYISYDKKQYQRVIEKGQGREGQKIKCIGKLRIRSEVLIRNYKRFGYN